MSESIEQVIDTNAEPVSVQSSEDKFFGVANEVNTSSSNEVEIEVVDDRPPEDIRPDKVETNETPVDDETVDKEITDYSKRAGDRISKSVVTQGGDVLNQQALNNAQWAKYNAQQKFKKAYEEGDADVMAASQAELAQATLAEQQAGNYAQTMQDNIASQYVEPVQQQQQVEKQPDPDMDNWSNKNPWFMSTVPEHQEMTSYALTIDKRLRNQGVLPEQDSPKYYAEVDKYMRNEYPNFFGVQNVASNETEVVAETPKRQVINPVAPATRNSGKPPRKIHLTQSQVALAKRLNITPEQYANQLLKES